MSGFVLNLKRFMLYAMDSSLTTVHPNAAGIDIGSGSAFVSIEGQQVKSFSTFTADNHLLITYLKEHQIQTVAMEATGIYWYSLYEMLESAGIEVWLVNGAHAKNVPGRKSDVQDCQWLRQLHSWGLLRRSFIPEELTRKLRTYIRLREDHLEMGASHIQHIQKALTSMNIRLHQVISQITGVSGMKVVKAILGGERDGKKLLALCDKQIIKNKGAEVLKSLEGNYKDEHLFALRQAVEGYTFYQQQLAACDAQIESLLQQISKDIPPPDTDALNRTKDARHNQPKIKNLHAMLVTITGGKDVAAISGFSDKTFLKLLGEIGSDVDAWPSAGHFVSWLGLSPRTEQSGKMRRRRKIRAKTLAGQIFREAAMAISESKSLAIGSFYRRIRSKRGPKIAIVAAARKLAIQFYNTLKYGVQFVEHGIKKYEEMQRQKMERFLYKKAQELGFQLINIQTAEVVH
jgi:transposase